MFYNTCINFCSISKKVYVQPYLFVQTFLLYFAPKLKNPLSSALPNFWVEIFKKNLLSPCFARSKIEKT